MQITHTDQHDLYIFMIFIDLSFNVLCQRVLHDNPFENDFVVLREVCLGNSYTLPIKKKYTYILKRLILLLCGILLLLYIYIYTIYGSDIKL